MEYLTIRLFVIVLLLIGLTTARRYTRTITTELPSSDFPSSIKFIREGDRLWDLRGDDSSRFPQHARRFSQDARLEETLSNLGDIVTSTNDVSDVNILSPFLLAPANRRSISMPIINNPLLIDSNCIFFKNHSYTCKTNCDSQSFDPIEYPVQGTPKLYYYLYNCSDDLNTKRGSWNTNDGLIGENVLQRAASEVVATCTFYRSSSYECFDVADCRATRCRGGIPWRGFYTGTYDTGFQGNLTAVALTNGNDGRSNPSTPQITSDKTKKQQMLENCKQRVLHHYCDADITYDEDADTRRCFKFAKSCRSVQGMERCTITFQPVDRHQHDNVVKVVYDKFGGVIKFIKQRFNMDVNVKCYFYSEKEFHCIFLHHSSDVQDLMTKYGDPCDQ